MGPRALAVVRCAAYCLATAAFFEGSSRLALSVDAFRVRVHGHDDASKRLLWLATRRGKDEVAYSFDVHDPTRGWALRPGIRDMPVFGDHVLNSNSRGLRGSREYSYEKHAGTPRVLVFGDSFTFGEEVSDDQTYSHYLEQALPGVEVLNFGVHGYGHDQMLLYLREEGVKYHPDVVVLGFLYDDMERNLLGFRDYAKPRFELRGGRLELRGVPVPPPEETLSREVLRSKFADLWTILVGRWRWQTGEAEDRMKGLTVAILDEMARVARAVGAVPAFAYLPVWGELTRTSLAMTRREQFFFGYCRERGIQSLYLQRFFLEELKAGARFAPYGHWTPEEHRIAARGIAAYMVEKKLLPDLGGPPGR